MLFYVVKNKNYDLLKTPVQTNKNNQLILFPSHNQDLL